MRGWVDRYDLELVEAMPPTNGSAQGSHSRNGVDYQRGIFA
jgi:hypothetical protein